MITCFLLAGFSSLSNAISCTKVELLKPGWMTMSLMLNSSCFNGSAVVLTSYSPSLTLRIVFTVLTNGRLKRKEEIVKNSLNLDVVYHEITSRQRNELPWGSTTRPKELIHTHINLEVFPKWLPEMSWEFKWWISWIYCNDSWWFPSIELRFPHYIVEWRYLHATATRPYQPRPRVPSRTLFCRTSTDSGWVKCPRVRRFPERNSTRRERECHNKNTYCPQKGRKSNIPYSHSRMDLSYGAEWY